MLSFKEFLVMYESHNADVSSLAHKALNESMGSSHSQLDVVSQGISDLRKKGETDSAESAEKELSLALKRPSEYHDRMASAHARLSGGYHHLNSKSLGKPEDSELKKKAQMHSELAYNHGQYADAERDAKKHRESKSEAYKEAFKHYLN